MGLADELMTRLKRRFEERLLALDSKMRKARSPRAFHDAEKELHQLALELADEVTTGAIHARLADRDLGLASVAAARAHGEGRGVKLLSGGIKETSVRLHGGTLIKVRARYLRAKPTGHRATRGKVGSGLYPELEELGIRHQATSALRLRVAHAVCEATSVSSARDLLQQSGLTIGHGVALRLTYTVSEAALRGRKEAMETSTHQPSGPFAGKHVVACIDGGRLCVRKSLVGRPKKGGRRKFRKDWREPKVLTLYVIDPTTGRRDKTIRSVIDATLGDATQAFAILLHHMQRMGVADAEHVTFAADGGRWIWSHLPSLWSALGIPKARRTEVLDFFHAIERVYDFAQSRVGWSEKKAARWAQTQKRRLKRGHVEKVIAAIEEHLTAKESRRSVVGYWERHRERMRYASFKKAGRPCGSGAVESAVRQVVNLRMKSASVCWREDHAEGVLHLRAYSKAKRWDELEECVLRTDRWLPKKPRAKKGKKP